MKYHKMSLMDIDNDHETIFTKLVDMLDNTDR